MSSVHCPAYIRILDVLETFTLQQFPFGMGIYSHFHIKDIAWYTAHIFMAYIIVSLVWTFLESKENN
jgi:hypothetical protein